MTYVRSVAPMRTAKLGNIIIAALLCIGGIFLITNPDIGTAAVGTLAGAAMIVFGVFRLIGYFSKDLYRLAFQFDLVFGAILVLLGLVMLSKPDNLLHVLCIVTGLYAIADGINRLRVASDAKRFGIRNWWLILSAAVLTCGIGLLLVFRPSASAQLMMRCIGLAMTAEGILTLITMLMTVKITKNQKPDVIEANYTEGD